MTSYYQRLLSTPNGPTKMSIEMATLAATEFILLLLEQDEQMDGSAGRTRQMCELFASDEPHLQAAISELDDLTWDQMAGAMRIYGITPHMSLRQMLQHLADMDIRVDVVAHCLSEWVEEEMERSHG